MSGAESKSPSVPTRSVTTADLDAAFQAHERVTLEAIREHRYDIDDRGSKPDDPGWHVCSCGWQGYWCDWQPHAAERIVSRLRYRFKEPTRGADGG